MWRGVGGLANRKRSCAGVSANPGPGNRRANIGYTFASYPNLCGVIWELKFLHFLRPKREGLS